AEDRLLHAHLEPEHTLVEAARCVEIVPVGVREDSPDLHPDTLGNAPARLELVAKDSRTSSSRAGSGAERTTRTLPIRQRGLLPVAQVRHGGRVTNSFDKDYWQQHWESASTAG